MRKVTMWCWCRMGIGAVLASPSAERHPCASSDSHFAESQGEWTKAALWRAGVGVASALLVLSGCGGGDPAPAGERASLPVTGAVQDSGEAQISLKLAINRLTVECMKAKGFDYELSGKPIRTKKEGPFGFEREEDGKPAQLEAPPAEPPKPEAPVTPAFILALDGPEGDVIKVEKDGRVSTQIPAKGCAAEAEEKVYESRDRRVRARQLINSMEEAQFGARHRMKSDQRYQKTLAKWSKCMKDSGHDYKSPDEVVSALGRDKNIGERPAFKDDIRCKKSTGFLVDSYRILSEYEHEAIKRDPGLVAEWRTFYEQVKRNADKINTSASKSP